VKNQILLDQPDANVCVIGNIVGLDSVMEEPVTLPERPFFLSVGSIEPRKNLHRLAEAFRSSGLAHDFELLLVGRQAWGELPEGVSVTGAVSDGELKSLYKNAQATFVPSFYEGFGLPVAEGLALGSPVFCSDIPVFREVAGPVARYFNPFDVDSIREALIAAAQLGAADRPAARNPYSVERTRKQLEAAYSLAAEVMS
jgi:glycosyltransferase involved in cell wall biosynthesis